MLKKLIEEILQDRSFTEAKIAKHIGVAQSTIHRIRTGKTTDPRFQTINRLLSLYFTLQHTHKNFALKPATVYNDTNTKNNKKL